MAWAMFEPTTFGIRSPSGDFLGFEQQIDELFETIPSEQRERKNAHDYRRLIIVKLTPKHVEFGPVRGEEVPTLYRLDKPQKKIGDLLELTSQILAVSSEMKDAIETVEPRVHQFFPLRFEDYKGNPLNLDMYILVIRQLRAALIPEQSDLNPYTDGSPDRYACHHNFGRDKKLRLVLDSKVLDGAHLWRETRWINPQLLISDTLRGEIKERDLTVFKHLPVEEV